ncbi:MAG: hypothetical protein IJZ62_04145 [Clostridia bacterium]|nr:hypothetical protein [Clostridia bacterium]
MEKLIASHMKNLGISRQEAIDLIRDDQRIDKGEKLFELSKEQEKNAKKARAVGRKPETAKRETAKKENPTKAGLINAMAQAMTNCGAETVNITNEERIFEFVLEGVKYKVTLSCPRS